MSVLNRNFESIVTNGVKLRCVVEGQGPLAILVHGWPESWYSWRHQIDPLVKAGYRVIVPDVRGYGGSDKPEPVEAYDMESLIGDVLGLISHFGRPSSLLIGHDWGAPIVWNTAALHPDRVSAVVALSVPYSPRGKIASIELWRQIYADRFFYQIYFQEPGVAEKELESDVRASLRKIYYAASGDAPKGLFRSDKRPGDSFLGDLPDPPAMPAWISEEDIAYYVSQFQESGFRAPLNRYRNQQRDWERLTQLSGARVARPACFLAGSRDGVLKFVPNVDLIENMKRWVDDLRICRLIEGAGHWLQQERPEEVNKLLLRFLGTL